MAAKEPRSDAADAEIRAIVHEEVNRLPEKYRAPVVLCYMEGRTRLEAAGALRLSEGVIKGRLERARGLLHKRLARRGVAFSVALLAAAAGADVSAAGAAAVVPAALAHATLRAALLAAAGKTAAAGTISGPVAALTQQVLQTMVVTPRQIASVVMLIVTLGIGAGLIAQQVFGKSEAAPPAALPAEPLVVRNHHLPIPSALAVPLGPPQADALPPPGMPNAAAVHGNTTLATLAGHTAAITALTGLLINPLPPHPVPLSPMGRGVQGEGQRGERF